MAAYYNELDPGAAAWLRELIAAGHIASGEVDERSIVDVRPGDLAGFTQCHFFAGIGVWSYALRSAGWPDDRPVWTGSCPCQPFSAAGRGKGFADERHLWPELFRLIRECRPDAILGEQVASKDGLAWLDTLQLDLEGAGYACGAVDTCAAGFGSPHIRQRLYWLAHALDGGREGVSWGRENGTAERGEALVLADARSPGLEGQDSRAVGDERQAAERGGRPSRLGHAERFGAGRHAGAGAGAEAGAALRPERDDAGPSGAACGLVNADGAGRLPGQRHDQAAGHRIPAAAAGGALLGLAHAAGPGWRPERQDGDASDGAEAVRAGEAESGRRGPANRPGPTNGVWSDPDWLLCRDGKWRPVRPGSFPLAHGVAARVGLLRGYGNAIVAPQAQAFIEAVLDVIDVRGAA